MSWIPLQKAAKLALTFQQSQLPCCWICVKLETLFGFWFGVWTKLCEGIRLLFSPKITLSNPSPITTNWLVHVLPCVRLVITHRRESKPAFNHVIVHMLLAALLGDEVRKYFNSYLTNSNSDRRGRFRISTVHALYTCVVSPYFSLRNANTIYSSKSWKKQHIHIFRSCEDPP